MGEEQIRIRGVNINQQITSGLILRGYTPRVFETRSDRLAALATNEKVDNNLFRAIRNHKPDGYIVAVGSGMSLSLPLGFNKDTPPRGVVLVDVDKHVIAYTKAFVNAVSQTKDWADFYNRFYRDPIGLAQNFLENDPDSQEALKTMDDYKRRSMEKQIAMSVGEFNHRISDEGRLGIDNVLSATYDIWKKLTIEGNVAVVHGSLIDEAVIDTITHLPEYQTSTNLIYLSNIADHIVRSKSWEGCTQYLNSYLQTLARYSPKEYPGLFLDTLRGYNYWLRVSKGVPNIYPADIIALGSTIFPEGFQPPHLHYEKLPKKFTPLNLFTADGKQLEFTHVLEEIYKIYPSLNKDLIKQMIKELGSLIDIDGEADLKYFGGLQPIEWARFRYGEVIGQATAVYLEEKKKEHNNKL